MLLPFTRSFLTTGIFVRRAYATLASLTGEQFRTRTPRGVKQLVEEILPLAAFLKVFEIPGRALRCRYLGPGGRHDAELTLAGPDVQCGFIKPKYFVEITSAVSPNDHLRREALNRYGSVFGGPDIRAVGSRSKGDRQVISRATAVEGTATRDDTISWVKASLVAKSKHSYQPPCILLINAEPEGTLDLTDWSMLARAVRGDVPRERFVHVFIVHWLTNIVFRV